MENEKNTVEETTDEENKDEEITEETDETPENEPEEAAESVEQEWENDPFLASEKAPDKPVTKNVTVISEMRGFLLEAICSNIQKNPLLVMKRVIADAGNAPEIDYDTDILVIYLEDNHRYLDKLLTGLANNCIRDRRDIPIFLAGGPNELALAKKKLVRIPIARSFCRPINVKELTEELEYIARDKHSQVRKRILIVDDDPVMIATLQGWFSKLFMVYSVNSGSNALNFLETHEVDLILLDYEMPVFNGPATLRMLRQKDKLKNIPVMFLTSKNDRDSVLSVKSLNVERYLLKSLSFEDIIQAIQKFFSKTT
ncbi:MAG: response regulator [Lachnospiraceae bacterium]|nr:response regulator [Lachnospiraceae bacterium]